MSAADSRTTARRLLGAHLTGRGVTLRITEVEAYAGEADPGSHAFRGRTPRNEVMFGPPGHLYCYFTYGMHTCCNYVCTAPGEAGAVLIRAGEVIDGAELARERRHTDKDRELARGPARLTVALGITLADNGVDLHAQGAPVRLHWQEPVAQELVRTGPRVGVSGPGGDGETYPWRFWIDGDPTVSPYRPAKPRRRRAG
ncbi:DNA-3-methyladenine glycosylase [Flexivirga aerilata]|nr:DNA-3-methyladenine glycosylase [Flexivirga aerilata]